MRGNRDKSEPTETNQNLCLSHCFQTSHSVMSCLVGEAGAPLTELNMHMVQKSENLKEDPEGTEGAAGLATHPASKRSWKINGNKHE